MADGDGAADAGGIDHERMRRGRTLAAVVVAVVFAGAGIAAAAWTLRDDRQPSPSVASVPAVVDDDDDESTTTTTIATPTTTTTPTTPTSTTSRGTTRPSSFLAVRENGDLALVVDGTPEVLGNEDFDEDDGPDYGIDAIALDRSHRRAHFSVCCEPASGALYSIGLDGRDRRPVNEGGGGYHPTVSPDGRSLAIGLYRGIGIIDLATGALRAVEADEFEGGGLRPAWSPDGATLAVEYGLGVESSVFLMQSDATSFERIRRITPAGKQWYLPTFRRDGRLLVVEQCCGFEPKGAARGVVVDPVTGAEVDSFPYESPVQDQAYDDTGSYLLYVTTDGVLRWRGGGKVEELGRGYRLADW